MPDPSPAPPLALFYVQLHDAIREELGVIINLASDFLSADVSAGTTYQSAVAILKTKVSCPWSPGNDVRATRRVLYARAMLSDRSLIAL